MAGMLRAASPHARVPTDYSVHRTVMPKIAGTNIQQPAGAILSILDQAAASTHSIRQWEHCCNQCLNTIDRVLFYVKREDGPLTERTASRQSVIRLCRCSVSSAWRHYFRMAT